MELITLKSYLRENVLSNGIKTILLNDWFILKQADMDDHIYPDNNCKYVIDIPCIKNYMQIILDENSCFSLKNLNINGDILMGELGLKPGKLIGEILHTLLEEVIDDKIVNDCDILLNRAHELI